MSESQQKGMDAERRARDYLVSCGLVFITQNYKSRFGEIDLIMYDDNILVFVEVRARASSFFGGGAQSINYHKQKKIIKTAALYMQGFSVAHDVAARCDVVSIDGVPPVLSWIKDAFR